MSKLPIVNKFLAGTTILTQQIVRKDGSIVNVTIERYDDLTTRDGSNLGTGFMFIVNGHSNFIAYSTSRKAINAAAKTTC